MGARTAVKARARQILDLVSVVHAAGCIALRLLPLLFLLLHFLLVFMPDVNAGRTADERALDAMMAGDMSGDGTGRAIFETAAWLCLRQRRRDESRAREAGHGKTEALDVHFFSSLRMNAEKTDRRGSIGFSPNAPMTKVSGSANARARFEFNPLEPAGGFPPDEILDQAHAFGARIETGDERVILAAVFEKHMPVLVAHLVEGFETVGRKSRRDNNKIFHALFCQCGNRLV